MVSLSVSEQAFELRCEDREGDERVAGVATDGALWIARDSQTYRILGRDGGSEQLDLGVPVSALVPWTHDSAMYATGDQLFVFGGEVRQEVRWPAELGSVQQLCGDPRVDGAFVLAALEGEAPHLYQRGGDEWWRWTPPSGSFGEELSLHPIGPACSGSDDEVWLTGTALHQLHLDRLVVHERADELAVDPALGIAARRGAGLEFLQAGEWVTTVFEAGPVAHVAGSAGVFWIIAGAQVHTYVEGAFFRAEFGAEMPQEEIVAIYPDSDGGAWLETPSRFCQAEPSAGVLRVSGIFPYQRTVQPVVEFRVITSLPTTVFVDEERMHEGGAEVQVDLGPSGWHSVRVEAGDQSREFAVYLAPSEAPSWNEDVQPIAEMHCGGGDCHGAERNDPTQISLVTFEDWTEHAETIWQRVGVAGDMPPPLRRSEWMGSYTTTIVSWIEGGMKETATP